MYTYTRNYICIYVDVSMYIDIAWLCALSIHVYTKYACTDICIYMWCMYRYMYIHVMHVQIYVYTCEYICIYVYVSMYRTYRLIVLSRSSHTTRTCYRHTCVHTKYSCINIYIYMYNIHMYIHVCKYVHTGMSVCPYVSP